MACCSGCCKSTAFGQLKLLLWKNISQKKRSWFALVCELFLPLVLYIVFLAARRNQPIETAPAEYNQAVPLPSAGWIPMLQFFCPETNQTDAHGFPIYTNNRVAEFLELLTMSPDGYPVKIETIESLTTFVKGALGVDGSKQTTDFNEAMNILMADPFFSKIITDAVNGQSNFSKESDQIHTVMRTVHSMASALPDNSACRNTQGETKTYENKDLHDDNLTTNAKETEFIVLDEDLDFKVPREFTVLVLRLWNSLQSAICGVHNTLNETIFDEPDWLHKLDFTQNQISKFQVIAFLLLRGHPQILYTPNTTDVNRIISKANETLRTLATFSEYSEMLFNASTKLNEVLEKNETLEMYGDQEMSTSFSDYDDYNEFGAAESLLPDIETLRDFTRSLIKITCFWNSFMSEINLDIFHPFPDEKSMARYSAEADRRHDIAVIAGVAFETNEAGELPPHVIYKLKLNDSYAPATVVFEERQWFQVHSHDDSHRLLLFSWIQDIVERAIIEDKVGRVVTEPGVYVREFPHPCRRADPFMHDISSSLSMLFILAWIYHVIVFTKSIVQEKEQRLKEMMKIMGLNNGVYWLSWFLTCLVEMSITTTLLLLIMKYGQLFPYSDPLLLWLYFMLNAVSSVLFSFFLSMFFSKAKVAAACAGIIFMITCLPYWYILNVESTSYTTVPLPVKIATCLISQSAHNLGIRHIMQYELQATGLQWYNINTPWPEFNQDLTIANISLFIILDWFIYVIIIWYLEAVYPGNYGIPKPWYFPFLKSYWCGRDSDDDECFDCERNDDKDDDVLTALKVTDNPQMTETIKGNNPVGVCIKRLVKVYRRGKSHAVKSLSLNLYESQITALLGHNGAGKTTIMSILTGFITPTTGTAFIYGKDIRKDMVEIRQSLGICPQFDALFNKLTVQEHVWFYSNLKGAPMKHFERDTDRLLSDMGLHHKKQSTVNTLSGGMKRKLSVAVAFAGGAKTVILDEPTAGVDPYARRAIWDLLQKYKQDRTILLSTHHMDEASLLGDRIAILGNGQLKCCGSTQYLKKNFGVGYQLTLVKNREAYKFDIDKTERPGLFPDKVANGSLFGLQLIEVTSFIQKYMPLAEFISQSDHELVYRISVEATPKSQFIELFDALGNNKKNLGISSFGLTETTLEQIFLSVIYADTPTHILNNGNTIGQLQPTGLSEVNNGNTIGQRQPTGLSEVKESKGEQNGHVIGKEVTMNGVQEKNKGHKRKAKKMTPSATMTIFGLLLKRIQYMKRDIKTFFSQLLLPVLFIASALALSVASLDLQKAASLILHSNIYKSDDIFVPYADETKFPLSRNMMDAKTNDSIIGKLIDALHYPAGLGAACLLPSLYNSTLDAMFHSNSTIELTSRDFNQMCRKSMPESLKVTFPYGDGDIERIRPGLPLEGVCHCRADSTGMECTDDELTISVPSYRVISGDILQNVTGRNLTHYFMKTIRKYGQKRYGALSFVELSLSDKMRNLNSSSPLRRLTTNYAAVAWYSADSNQSATLYTNVMNNAILRANINPELQGSPSAYGITLINEPIKSKWRLVNLFMRRAISLQISLLMLLGIGFIPSSVIVFIVYERAIKAKHLQFISGTSPFVYWLSNYIWDMLTCLVPIGCCIAIVVLLEVPVYSMPKNLPAVAMLFVLFAWSAIPMMYPASFLFTTPSTAFVISAIFHICIGLIPTILMFFLQHLFYGQIFETLSVSLHRIFRFIPNYCFAHGLVQMSYIEMINTYYETLGLTDKIQSSYDFLTSMFVIMAIEGVVFFALAVLCEYRLDERLHRYLGRGVYRKRSHYEEDEDVEHEKQRILQGLSNDVLRLVNLTKIYKVTKLRRGRKSNRKLTAVDKICLGVPQGQCFGLLGINGAGKTTLFQMLTGDKSITSGDVYVHGHSIKNDIRSVYRHIGYCPQVDALYDKLTGREHLMLYAKLRGVPAKQRNEVVESLLETINLLDYGDKLVSTYSGGNKRKLSTAISLVGNPSLIFMDEPTTGMDPQSKRFLWKIIHNIVQSGTSVVFTSHSMEECEHLCSRLAIMVNGQFKCIGSRQHLKSKFGDGYTVTVSLNRNLPNQQLVRSFFHQAFPESVIKDSHCNMVQFEVKSISLSDVFSTLESMKETFDIEDYSVQQTSLDDVFINFAKKQHKSAMLTTDSEDTSTVTQSEDMFEMDSSTLSAIPYLTSTAV